MPNLIPASMLSSSIPTWVVGVLDPIRYVPGFAFSCAMSSGKVFANTTLFATKAEGTKAMSEIGSKSFNGS